MNKWTTAVVIFLIGVATALLFNSTTAKKQVSTSLKSVEISKDVTSTSRLSNLPTAETVIVKRVIDGDTVELVDGKRVRYIGMDTPELYDPRKPVECFGKEAKEENKRLVENKTIRLEKDISETDKYGRLLRYVYVNEVMVNDYLVRQGFARASTFPPDVKYVQRLRLAEQEAREQNRGLWSGCTNNPTNQ